jgi:hypothetical protein
MSGVSRTTCAPCYMCTYSVSCFAAHRTAGQSVPLEDSVLSVGTQNQQEPRLQRSANGAADNKYDGHLQAATMRARPQLGPMIPYACNEQNNVSFDYRLHVRSAPAFELQMHGLRLGSELPQCWSDGRAQSAPSGSSERMMPMLHQGAPGLEHATSANSYAPFDSGSWGDGDAAYWP